jgi:DNA repair protein RadC
MSLSIKTQNLVNEAIKAMEQESPVYFGSITSVENSVKHCRLKIGASENEKFLVLFLNTQNEIIKSEIMFLGTINSAAVYPREIVKRALELNANSIILSHNHPSGKSEPSRQDIQITDKISKACQLLDINVLDHIIVCSTEHTSFAERGLM